MTRHPRPVRAYNRDISSQFFTFGLPPSLGQEPSWALAREFAEVLFDAGIHQVVPFKTYEALDKALATGEVAAAWGPPMICARVEAAGGSIAMRGIRGGAVTYRSAILVRRRDALDLDMIRNGAFRPRAVWVDQWSAGGYLLARAHLRSIGIDASMFLSERMLGSYAACFDALNERDADLTAAFANARGLEVTWGEKMVPFRVLEYTSESPNDGIAITPMLNPERRAVLVRKLEGLLAANRSRGLLATAFSVDGFDRPPPGTYAPLLAL